jgi:methylated-DNA-[protein]-cysteine S-methyltransferase
MLKATIFTSDRGLEKVLLDPAPEFSWKLEGPSLQNLEEWMDAYISKKKNFPVLKINFNPLTPFSQAVLRELQNIPFGGRKSYGEIANAIGRPDSARAVGRACGANPFPLIVPCHRVVGATGALTGFAFGLPLKQAILQHELT